MACKCAARPGSKLHYCVISMVKIDTKSMHACVHGTTVTLGLPAPDLAVPAKEAAPAASQMYCLFCVCQVALINLPAADEGPLLRSMVLDRARIGDVACRFPE